MKKITLNESQLNKLIKEAVKETLKESNYDDYEYFNSDGTGGRDINPYPYGSREADLFDSGDKDAQMNYDWEQLESDPDGADGYWKESFPSDKEAEMWNDYSKFGNRNIREGYSRSVPKKKMNESKLNRIIRESILKVLKESK